MDPVLFALGLSFAVAWWFLRSQASPLLEGEGIAALGIGDGPVMVELFDNG